MPGHICGGLAVFADKLRERFGRVRHFRVGATAQQIDEVQRILSGREYYYLYDDLYRAVHRAGGSQERDSEIVKVRLLIYRDFERIRSAGLLCGVGTRLLDLGCGEGDNAAYFARLGFQVTGIDISPTAIDVAARLANEQGLRIDFRVADVLELAEFPDSSFDLATDIGCLHMLVREEHRRRYLRSVRRILRSGGVFFLFNRVASRNVRLLDEDAAILRSITLMQTRWRANDGSCLNVRGCGFRNASMPQYRQELEASGFEIVRSHRGWGRHRRFAMLLARAS